MVKTKLPYSLLLALLLIGIGLTTGMAQTVNEYTDADTLQAGDVFQFSITLDRTEDYDEVIFPDSADFGEVFEIRSRQQFRISDYKDSLSYELQFFGTGDTLIPQLPVQMVQNDDTTTQYTASTPIFFQSLLSGDDDTLRPLKPIFDFAAVWWPYILALLIIVVAGYYLYQYYLQQQVEEQQPEPRREFSPTAFVNPLKQLQTTIRNLEQMELADEKSFERFYVELGDAIRRYFENLHDIPALESTSRELLQLLKSASIDKNLIADTRAVLQEADMVKFARFQPTKKQAERALRKANDFLQRARKVDGPRVDHLRREHHARMESERERFEQEQLEQEQERNS